MSDNFVVETLDLRIIRSRKYLVDSLFTLMKEKSFQKISVSDITQKAMVNRSTFYAHFVDKYDLFETAIGQRIRTDLTERLSNDQDLNADNLRAVILLTGEIMLKIFDQCMPTPQHDLLPLILTQMQNNILVVIRSWAKNLVQENRKTIDAETLALVCAGTIFGSVNLWAQGKRELTIDELADQIMPVMMDGIRGYVKQ